MPMIPTERRAGAGAGGARTGATGRAKAAGRGWILLAGMMVLAMAAAWHQAGATFTSSNNKQSATFAVGDTFDVQLGANPSAGFVWLPTDDSSDTVKMVDEEQVPADPPNADRPSVQDMRFQAVSKGHGQLKLAYAGPDPGKPPVDTFVLNITVQ